MFSSVSCKKSDAVKHRSVIWSRPNRRGLRATARGCGEDCYKQSHAGEVQRRILLQPEGPQKYKYPESS